MLGFDEELRQHVPAIRRAQAFADGLVRNFAWDARRTVTPAERHILRREFVQLLTNPTITSGLDTTCRIVELADSQGWLGRPTTDGAVWMMLRHELGDYGVAWAFVRHGEDPADALSRTDHRGYAGVASEDAA